MILADTSVWADHFRSGETGLVELLEEDAVLIHPLIVAELACGNLTPRTETLALLRALPQALLASHDEILEFIEAERLHGAGIGAADAHLLASARLGRARLWSKDGALRRAASRLKLSA